MPFDNKTIDPKELNDFNSFLDTMQEFGAVTPEQAQDQMVYDQLIKEYGKSFDNPALGRVKQASLESAKEQGINSLGQLKSYQTKLTEKIQQEETDSAWSYSIDNMQKMFGEAINTIGDALATTESLDNINIPTPSGVLSFEDPFFGGVKKSIREWLGEQANQIGSNIVKQQDEDIKRGGYKSTYQGGLLDQKSIADSGGWVLEKLAENWATTGLALVGTTAAAVTTGGTSLAFQASTLAGTALLGIGETASELKDKGVYDRDESAQVLAIGMISGSLDAFGASKAIPKGAAIRRLFQSGVVDQVAHDIKKSGILKDIGKGFTAEGITEVMQEGIQMSYAASQGADYSSDEVLDRVISSFVVGGAMGGSMSGSVSSINSAVEHIRSRGETPSIPKVSEQIKQNNQSTAAFASQYDGQITGLTPSQAARLAANTALTESSFDPTIINDYGYSGLYQFGASALVEVGLVKRSAFENAPNQVKNGTNQRAWLENSDNWTIEGGLNTFLSNQAMQSKAFTDLANANIKTGKRLGALSNNSSAEDIAAFVKAAHLKGAGAAIEYFKHGADDTDANGTSMSKYARQAREAIKGNFSDERPYQGSSSAKVTAPDGKKYPVRYEVMDAANLSPSVNKSISQYRDRNRQALTEQVKSIANNPDFDLVSSSPIMDVGAPVLSQEGDVIGGNGRLLGIQGAYQTNRAEAYRQALISNADQFGLNRDEISNMQQPVLIRRFTEPVDVARLAIQSNIGGSAPMSALEQAKIDATEIQSLSDFNPNEDGTIDFKSAAGLFKRLIQNMPAAQANSIIDKTGNVSSEGQKRVQNALLYMAYGDSPVLPDLVESAKPESIKILRGLTGAAPALAEMKDSIRQGIVYDQDVTPDVVEAVKLYNQIKKDGNNTVDSFFRQQDAFTQVSEEVQLIVRKLDEFSDKPNAIRDFLVGYTEALKNAGSPSQNTLFASSPPSKIILLQQAINPAQLTLTSPAPAPAPAPAPPSVGTQNPVSLNAMIGGSSQPPSQPPDWDAASAYTPPNPNDKKGGLLSFLTQWLRSPVRRYGAKAQNALERYQATPNNSHYIISKPTLALKDYEKTNGSLSDSDRSAMYDYLTKPSGQKPVVNPELKGLLDGMRSDVDKLSNAVIEQVRRDASRFIGRDVDVNELLTGTFNPVTDSSGNVVLTSDQVGESLFKQSERVKFIAANKGQYLTRTYAIHTHPDWWEKSVLQSNEDSFKTIRKNALQYFDSKNLAENPTLTTDERQSKALQDMIDFVLDRKSKELTEGLLQGRDKELENHPELRALLGEHTDPMDAYAYTVTRVNELVAVKDFYEELSRANLKVFDSIDAEGKLRPINVSKGDIFHNPFYGKYAEPHVAEFIENALDTEVMNGFTKVASAINGVWQTVTVPLSIPTSVSNITSTVPILIATGSLNPKVLSDSFKTIGNIFISQKIGELDRQATIDRYGYDPDTLRNYMTHNQISHGGALEGEIKANLKESGIDKALHRLYMNPDVTLSGKAIKTTSGLTGKALEVAMRTYAAGDSAPKIPTFLSMLQMHKGLRAKYGEDVIVDSLGGAGHAAKQFAPQYSRIPKLVNMFRRLPTHGLFVAFKAQTHQTVKNQAAFNFAMMRADSHVDYLKDYGINLDGVRTDIERQQLVKELRTEGMKRMSLLGTMVAAYPALIGGIASAFLGGGDEPSEEELAAINKLMPEYYRFSEKAWIGRDENGYHRFINTGRASLWGDINQAINIIKDYEQGDIPSADEAAKLFAEHMANPFYSAKFFGRLISFSTTGQDQYGRDVLAPEDGTAGNVLNVGKYLMGELVTNGTSKVAEELYYDLLTENDYNEKTGEPYDASNAMMLMAGMQVIKFDPKKQSSFWLATSGRKKNQLKTRLSGRLKSFGKMSDNDITDALSLARDEHNRIYIDLMTKIESAKLLGLSQSQLYEAIKLAGFSKKDYDLYLKRGRIPPMSLDRLGDRQAEIAGFRSLPNQAKQNVSSNYDQARRLLNSLPAQ